MPYSSPIVLAEGYTLVSLWKPLLMILPFLPWGWLVSKRLDKHAARFILPREFWGTVHLVCGTVALLAVLAMPMKSEAAFWVGWGIAIVILVGDVVAFVQSTNKDERVPEKYQLTLANLFADPEAPKKAKNLNEGAGRSQLVMKGPDKAVVQVPENGSPEFQARVAAENVYVRAIASRASQVDIAPSGKENVYLVSVLVDGIRSPLMLADPVVNKDGAPPPPPGLLPAAEAVRIVDVWKAAAKLDVADRRKKLVGDVTVEREDRRQKVRVTSIGTSTGMKATLVFDPEGAVRRVPDKMGLLEIQATELKALVEESQGVVLQASPQDAGRTTTMYTLLKMHDAYTRNVQVVEIDQQDTLEGIRQTIFNPQAEGAEFSTTVRSLLRRDPDVLAVAELPDANTAKEVARADQRVRVYVSMRADSSLQAIQQWMKAAGDPDAGSKCLHGVICQKLVRKLCNNCRVAYQPSPDMLKKLKLPPDKVKQLFKKGGKVLIKNKEEVCPACSGVGYVGLEGVFEVFSIDANQRTLIKAGDLNALRVEWRKKNLPTIPEAALRKALDGTTSVEEVLRVTAEEAPAQAKAPAAPAAPAPAAKP